MSLEGFWAGWLDGSLGASMRGVSIIEPMVIDMNEAQVRTLEQVRQVVAGTQALEFRSADDDEGRYAWIEQVLQRFGYRQLQRAERGVVLAYLQRLSGYSRAQLTRLVSRWTGGNPLVKNYRRPQHAFARRYTGADVVLLAEVDRAMGTLSGPATACVLRRQRDVFADGRFERLGSISVAHLYNLRASVGYRAQRVVLTKTRPTKAVTIGVRKAPAPEGRPGFVRIDSVHQGDWDGTKGLYHINAVDCVTQWQVVATVQTISEAHLLPVIEQMLAQFPFLILGFHADNGSEYVNHRVAAMLAYFSPTWTAISADRGRHFRRTWTLFQADRGRRFSLNVDDPGSARVILTAGMLADFSAPPCPPTGSRCVTYDRLCACTSKPV
jgi:AraC-like DNA-binding protein